MNTANPSPSARSRIYRYLYRKKGFCSRQDLAQALDLSMPTIYQNLSALYKEGLAGDSGETRSTGGRKAGGLAIIPDVRIAIGVYITRDEFQIVATDLTLRVIASQTTPYPNAREFLLQKRPICDYIEQFLDRYNLSREKILGVSITLPAILSADGMQLFKCPTMQLENLDLKPLTEGIPYPVHIENNGTSGGNAEIFCRGSQQNLAYLFLEDGVGGMLHIGGTAYNGDNNMSGEFGHICVHPGGLRCNCGRRGCLEAYCSNYRLSSRQGISLEEFFDALKRHDPGCTLLWDDYLLHLAIGVTNLRSALDCDIVLGGFMIRYLRPYFPLLKEYVAAESWSGNADFLQPGLVEDYPAPRGAALYFIEQFVKSI